MSTPPRKLPLGELLVQKGIITPDQLRIALLEQKKSGQPLGKTLVTLGFVTEATMREGLSENLGAQRFYGRHGFGKTGEYEFPVGRVRDREFILRRPAPGA